jgi:CHAD domain-containing protein
VQPPLLPAAAWLDELAQQIERNRASVEPEAVHRLRVAAGRVSVWLELGARRALRDDLRRLRRSAAAVRDLDVISAAEGGAALHESLRVERAAEAERFAASLSDEDVEALVEALAVVPPPDAVDVRAALQRQKRRVLRAGDALDDPDDPAGALHRLRRRVRRLRYALEWLGADAQDLKSLQEHLGHVNDLAIELARLEARRGDHALAARTEAVRREIAERRAAACTTWRELRPRIGEL